MSLWDDWDTTFSWISEPLMGQLKDTNNTQLALAIYYHITELLYKAQGYVEAAANVER